MMALSLISLVLTLPLAAIPHDFDEDSFVFNEFEELEYAIAEIDDEKQEESPAQPKEKPIEKTALQKAQKRLLEKRAKQRAALYAEEETSQDNISAAEIE